MIAKIPRIMIAAAGSNSGKTTITCAILQAFMKKGLTPSAFKCGPDFIDPMFHTEVIGTKSRNLDLFLLPEDVCKYLLVKNARESQIAVLEGVMGYYDGLGIGETTASSYHLAGVTKTPVILVINCAGAALSIAAQIQGFSNFRPNSRVKGVILNNLSPALYPSYKSMIEHETNIAVIGYFPKMSECSLESRHLGLITAAEVENLQHKLDLLADQALASVDLDQMMEIARENEEIDYCDYPIENIAAVTLAVARDKAFCFYYQDSLELLEQMGARIEYFSPLKDEMVPACDGIILGGGYPEIFAKELAENKTMLQQIRNLLDKETPCIAECGGFMYLLDSIKDKDGNQCEMAGFLKGNATLTDRLHRFGYITLTAQHDNLLCKKGESINAHEFHYSDSTLNGESFIAERPSGKAQWNCIHANEHLAVGYPHMHLWGNTDFARSFIEQCRKHKDMQLNEEYPIR
ncbi:cobyrinate a,c-diamide synthase [Dehalobacter sp. DCM]|uniref:cobyrinate a,c-diamide synthase n=1 Tax=Dehalobacter sp. DCM TaxID=2907827 RepID=UPI0030819006|nr:cobyrinate a,c-diamide synthase [Dehalobacter sp. DCM]